MNGCFLSKEWVTYALAVKGIHSVHSPFVFDFYQNVLYDRRQFYCYDEIEKVRSRLNGLHEKIIVKDFGAGSSHSHSHERRISEIAKDSCTPPKYAKLLFRIASYYQRNKILELGTSLGITSLYLSSAGKDVQVITIEAEDALSDLAEKNFRALKKDNIALFRGTFKNRLQSALDQLSIVELAYLDGYHRKEATLRYFRQILPFTSENTIMVFDDIRWSEEMKQAWEEIVQFPQITVSIDLFRMGIIFFRKELSKQHFVLRW